MRGKKMIVRESVKVEIYMEFYEMEKNEVKYGDIQKEKGVINIKWEIMEDKGEKKFKMRWEERRGKEVMKKERRGLGKRMMNYVMEEEMKEK